MHDQNPRWYQLAGYMLGGIAVGVSRAVILWL
jgi:hypothetical protein